MDTVKLGACGLDTDGIMPDYVTVYIGKNDRDAGFLPASDDKSALSV